MDLIPWPSGPPQALLHLGANGSEPHPAVTVHSEDPQPWAPPEQLNPKSTTHPLPAPPNQTLGRQEPRLGKGDPLGSRLGDSSPIPHLLWARGSL